MTPPPSHRLVFFHMLFSEATAVLETAVASLVKHRYGRANPTLKEEDTGWRRDLDTLRHAELSHVASLVRGPQRPGKGWVYF